MSNGLDAVQMDGLQTARDKRLAENVANAVVAKLKQRIDELEAKIDALTPKAKKSN